MEWSKQPWEAVSSETLSGPHPGIASEITGKSEKVYPGDVVRGAYILQCSSTELTHYKDHSIDLVITDPPFGELLHYSELADFFHVWMHLPLKEKYPDIFAPEYTPKLLERFQIRRGSQMTLTVSISAY